MRQFSLEHVAKAHILGDTRGISKMVADPSKLKRLLGWKPKYDDVDLIVRSALDWERGL